MSEQLMSEQASEWAGERGWPTPAHPRGLASALTYRIGIPQDFDAGTHGTRRARGQRGNQDALFGTAHRLRRSIPTRPASPRSIFAIAGLIC